MSARDTLEKHTIQHLENIHESATDTGSCLWLVAWSGGLDSSVLLDLCTYFVRDRSITLVTAHVDHGLRESSAKDAAFCKDVASRHPVIAAHHTLKVEVDRSAGSTQEAARQARWKALLDLAAQLGADALLTGHHLDDAIETLLLNGGRGAGVCGLLSMYTTSTPPPLPHHGLPGHVMVHRPLYRSSRDEIDAYARARGVRWVDDPTNASDAYARNRLRHHVLPPLFEEQGGRAGWRRTLDILREEGDFIEAQVDALARRAVSRDDPWKEAWSLSREECETSHSLLLKRLLLRIHGELPTRHPAPKAAHLEAFIALCHDTSRASGCVAMPGLRVEAELERIVVLHAPRRGSRGWFDEAQQGVEVVATGEREGRIEWAGQTYRWRVCEDLPGEDEVLWWGVDKGSVARCILRGGRPGERLKGRRLREGLRELRVPAWRRHLWPCLADESGLVAVKDWRQEVASSHEGVWIVLWHEK